MLENAIANRRVSLDDIIASVDSVHYFTAADGVFGADVFAPRYTNGERTRDVIKRTSPALGVLTFCVLVLKNGFTVTGQSACADPVCYNQEIGQKIAYDNAIKQVWPLMGYALRDALDQDEKFLKNRKFEAQPDFGVYVGTRVVHAIPMSRQVYNDFRNWSMPANEQDDDGYLVEYTDRIENMIEGFRGYISWSPKDVFELAYRKL